MVRHSEGANICQQAVQDPRDAGFEPYPSEYETSVSKQNDVTTSVEHIPRNADSHSLHHRDNQAHKLTGE